MAREKGMRREGRKQAILVSAGGICSQSVDIGSSFLSRPFDREPNPGCFNDLDDETPCVGGNAYLLVGAVVCGFLYRLSVVIWPVLKSASDIDMFVIACIFIPPLETSEMLYCNFVEDPQNCSKHLMF